MSIEDQHGEAGERTQQTHIQLPAPTFFPIVFAFGVTLLFAGLLTFWLVSFIGFLVFFVGALGWWRNVIPHEDHELVSIEPEHRPAPVMVETRSVVRLRAGEQAHRMRIPIEVHPYTAGIVGGLAGGAAMAALACLYGLVAEHSIWYPVNLLAGVVIPGLGHATTEQLRQFMAGPFIAALIGHIGISILVGVVYAAILPMFPKYAPLWAGVLMPLFWSGLTYPVLDIINPALNRRISWPWFVICQLAFGLVGGFFVARSTHIKTLQSLPMAERAALHYPTEQTSTTKDVH
ncbi:MAG: hypothetical protein JO270_18935 [Acidobacteriaceae bacterium]|nr:hypothetical protein [Acidobacteriaceae bacterium]MBV8569154.1 hypothetical protein [Acidobacteriaceae bacterium]